MTQQSPPQPPRAPDPEPPVIELYEIIKAIAKKIELPEDWDRKLETCASAAFGRGGPGTENPLLLKLQAGVLAGSLKSSFRLWRAAAALHFCLKEKASHGPKWRNWMATGLPAVLDPDERKQAMVFLERITQDHEGRLQAYLQGRVDAGLNKAASIPPLFSHAEARWVECLGFERTELINLLDEAGIPHALVSQTENGEASGPIPTHSARSESPLPAASGEESRSASTLTAAAMQDPVQPSAIATMVNSLSGNQPAPHQQASAPAVGQPRLHDTGKVRYDALDDQIDKAIELASGSYRKGSVWKRLKELALAGEPPFTGISDKKGALYYHKDEYKEGEAPIGTFTRNALDLRLKRRWENLGHVGPRR